MTLYERERKRQQIRRYDQMSNDLKASEAFYRSVTGWSIGANAMNSSEYSSLEAGDAIIGSLMPIPEDSKRAVVRPGWMGYVDDVDIYAGHVKAVGGAMAGGVISKQPSEPAPHRVYCIGVESAGQDRRR